MHAHAERWARSSVFDRLVYNDERWSVGTIGIRYRTLIVTTLRYRTLIVTTLRVATPLKTLRVRCRTWRRASWDACPLQSDGHDQC